jgi:hypothetical protein
MKAKAWNRMEHISELVASLNTPLQMLEISCVILGALLLRLHAEV